MKLVVFQIYFLHQLDQLLFPCLTHVFFITFSKFPHKVGAIILIKRVITKSHDREPGVRFVITCKFDFRPKLHDTKCNFHFITFILKSTSGNASLFTKYAPKLAPSCNIATCEQNGRDTKLGDTKQ